MCLTPQTYPVHRIQPQPRLHCDCCLCFSYFPNYPSQKEEFVRHTQLENWLMVTWQTASCSVLLCHRSSTKHLHVITRIASPLSLQLVSLQEHIFVSFSHRTTPITRYVFKQFINERWLVYEVKSLVDIWLVTMLWGNYGRESAVVPGHDRPPMERRKESKK